MTDITIGQYYPADSIIHRLDPRVKLFGTMVYIVCLFVSSNIFGYLFDTVALASVILLGKIPVGRLVKGLKPILFILLFGAILNLFFTTGGTTLVDYWIINITTEGVRRAVFMAIRLIFMVVGTSIMTLTTKPADIADAIEKSFGFLKKIKFPVHEIAMMMSLALRFIPTLMEETDKIMKAQKARGADFETGNIVKRVKNYIPLLLPLFVSAMSRALDLATAMEARCYNGGNRTKLKPLIYKKADFISYGIFLVYTVVMIGIHMLVLSTEGLSTLIL